MNECQRHLRDGDTPSSGPGGALRDALARATRSAQEFRLCLPMLGALLPMFLWVDPEGRIRAMGPTLGKIIGGDAMLGHLFCECFRIGRRQDRGATHLAAETPAGGDAPAGRSAGDCPATLASIAHERMVHLTLVSHPEIGLRGETFALGPEGENGTLMTLSFGFYLREAVVCFALTERDFSPADLAMELLYLQEAKTLVMQELRALTSRLDGARRQAETQALTDPLTRLANRRAMEEALQQASAGPPREGRPSP